MENKNKFQEELQELILARKAGHDAVDDYYDEEEEKLTQRYEEARILQEKKEEIRKLEEELEKLKKDVELGDLEKQETSCPKEEKNPSLEKLLKDIQEDFRMKDLGMLELVRAADLSEFEKAEILGKIMNAVGVSGGVTGDNGKYHAVLNIITEDGTFAKEFDLK